MVPGIAFRTPGGFACRTPRRRTRCWRGCVGSSARVYLRLRASRDSDPYDRLRSLRAGRFGRRSLRSGSLRMTFCNPRHDDDTPRAKMTLPREGTRRHIPYSNLGDRVVKIVVRLEPATESPRDVSYRWDADTDILSAQLSSNGSGDGMSGSVGLEGD